MGAAEHSIAYSIAFSILGWCLVGCATAMVISAAVAVGYSEIDNAWTFLMSSGLTLFVGGALVIVTRGIRRRPNQRDTFLVAVLFWLIVPIFGSLPFFYGGVNVSVTDAYFEAMSGLTTTGATVFSQLENSARGILFWRALLQWSGGLATLMLAIVLLSFYRFGPMSLFRSAMPRGKRNDLRLQLTQALASLSWVYLLLTGLCVSLLIASGVGIFESFCLAMSTLSTGGFSTRDGSISSFNLAQMEVVLIIFMLVGAINFTFHWAILSGKGWKSYYKDPEFRYILFICSGVTLFLWLINTVSDSPELGPTIRTIIFIGVSMITTTGYFPVDPGDWPLISLLVVTGLALIGGCTGSTSGGMKLLRFSLLFKAAAREIKQLAQPKAVYSVTYGDATVENHSLSGALIFFFIYMILMVIIGFILSFYGLELRAAFSTAAAALNNAGPGIILVSGIDGNYGLLADEAKWLLCFAMLIGRLEIFPLLVVFANVMRRI